MIIRLPKGEWNIHYDDQLGQEGGFGIVYSGSRDGYPPLAIKKLKLTASEASNRELRIAEKLSSESLKYIVPVFDYGQDSETDNYFIVMAKAEKNLRDELVKQSTFTVLEASNILIQIVKGLDEVDDIVHRDLKPENILYHDGIWKLSDFGISRFVEESTSLNTLKDFMTYAYAAPEQWKGQRVSSATDLYAVGCIAYELITGKPPFTGSDASSYQQQHLNSEIPPLNCDNSLMRGLVSMLLRKLPESRPPRNRVLELLDKIVSGADTKPNTLGSSNIASIGAREAERIAEQERQQEVKRFNEQKRFALAKEAFRILFQIREKLFKDIIDSAPTAKRKEDSISLGSATLSFSININRPFLENPFAEVGWDVICGAMIMVFQSLPKKYTRSASFWYTNQGLGESYRWIEVSYWDVESRLDYQDATPFGFEDPSNAVKAHIRGYRNTSIATRPRPIDDEATDTFIERWLQILALAYDGKLTYPSSLPID